MQQAAGPSSRRGGVMDNQEIEKPKELIVVDMREFRSELPSLIHRRGIDIHPVTIEVGDYILTPNICVERKSVSDLISSLNSGRLYNQAQAMTRAYAKPMLLIEFDHNKSFTLNLGKYFYSNDAKSTDVTARLQLLTLHFPKLKIIWSPGPYATAELFHKLKEGQEQPDPDQAVGITAEEDTKTNEQFNPVMLDFVSKMPGIGSRNIRVLMRKIRDLEHLLSLTEIELSQVLESSANGKLLYEGLHNPIGEQIKIPDNVKDKGKGGRFKALGAAGRNNNRRGR
jgi:DNA excision repair protein ERCC-4